jgi:hypothetical protein
MDRPGPEFLTHLAKLAIFLLPAKQGLSAAAETPGSARL